MNFRHTDSQWTQLCARHLGALAGIGTADDQILLLLAEALMSFPDYRKLEPETAAELEILGHGRTDCLMEWAAQGWIKLDGSAGGQALSRLALSECTATSMASGQFDGPV